jgi:N-acetylglucosamine-6-phosphate deacetylase
MIVLSGAELVLPDRILTPGTLTIEGDRIVDVRAGSPAGSRFAFEGHYIVPGFIDVHVHGVDGVDSLGRGDAITSIAARLPRYGVTAFCPTTVACPPAALRSVLEQIGRARAQPSARSARVLPAHLESNFVNEEYKGAQPAACLRSPGAALMGWAGAAGQVGAARTTGSERLRPERGVVRQAHRRPPALSSVEGPRESERRWGPASTGEADFDAGEILREIERAAPDVGIVTLAPELEGGLDLVGWLAARGHRVALGHSAATFDEAQAAIAAGARHATHLFNRMPPFGHRAPGLVGAVLHSEEVAAELICDGVHVHPAVVRTTIAAKRASRVMAITDATAAAGLPVGSRATLGTHTITAGESAALLADGTLAGSVLTMDRAFRVLVEKVGLSLVDAVTVCSTTPARELVLVGHGVLAADAVADVVVLDRQLSVVQTYIAGQLVYSRV